ncbi:MAG: hypothetical protein ABIL18_09095 [candidate division WOR-3 bacterium]
MEDKREWETESLEWIHKVREEIDQEIRKKGITLGQWVKEKSAIDLENLCRKYGFKNFVIVEKIKKGL